MFGFEPVERPSSTTGTATARPSASARRRRASSTRPATARARAASSSRSERLLFTGDTLFSGSVGRTDLPGGDFDALLTSIQEKLFPLGDDVRFHPGHGPAGLIGEERRSNPFVGESRGAARGGSLA